MKKIKIGDSVKFKSGKLGIVEDYDDKYIYVRDTNANLVKVKKVKDSDEEDNEPIVVSKFELDPSSIVYEDYEYDDGEFKVLYTVSFIGDDLTNIFGTKESFIWVGVACYLSDADVDSDYSESTWVPYGSTMVEYESGGSYIENIDIDDNYIEVKNDSGLEFVCDGGDDKSFENFADDYNVKYTSDPNKMLNEALKKVEKIFKDKFKEKFEDWAFDHQDYFSRNYYGDSKSKKLKDDPKALQESEYKEYIGEQFKHTFNFKLLDLVASIVHRVMSYNESIEEAIDLEMTSYDRQWLIMRHYQVPSEADYGKAEDMLVEDIEEIIKKIKGEKQNG